MIFSTERMSNSAFGHAIYLLRPLCMSKYLHIHYVVLFNVMVFLLDLSEVALSKSMLYAEYTLLWMIMQMLSKSSTNFQYFKNRLWYHSVNNSN